MSRVPTAVLISGRGSNLASLLAAAADAAYPADIRLVLSNRADAAGLDHARQYGVSSVVVERKRYPDRASFDAAMDAHLAEAGVRLVCLAGFMRLLTPEFIERWRDQMINIHPSLLPSFPGLHTHERALAAGVRIHGATVHFVRFETDTGPIIAQAAVPVEVGDTPETLGARVLQVEHRLYPAALARVASGAARVERERLVEAEVAAVPVSPLFVPLP